jgi:hypothetical protein
VPDFLISAGDEQEKGIAANLRHRMLLMTATVLLTAAMLRGLIASIAPVAGQVGRGLDAGPSLVGLLTSIPVLCFAACMPAAIALVRVAGTAFALTVSVTGAIFGCTLRSAGGLLWSRRMPVGQFRYSRVVQIMTGTMSHPMKTKNHCWPVVSPARRKAVPAAPGSPSRL